MKLLRGFFLFFCLFPSAAFAGTVYETTCSTGEGSFGAAFVHSGGLYYLLGDDFSLKARGQTVKAPLTAIKQYRNSAELYLLIDLASAGIKNEDGTLSIGALEISAQIQNNLPEDLWQVWEGTAQLITPYDILSPLIAVRCEMRQ